MTGDQAAFGVSNGGQAGVDRLAALVVRLIVLAVLVYVLIEVVLRLSGL